MCVCGHCAHPDTEGASHPCEGHVEGPMSGNWLASCWRLRHVQILNLACPSLALGSDKLTAVCPIKLKDNLNQKTLPSANEMVTRITL